jgi:hypothetical protein
LSAGGDRPYWHYALLVLFLLTCGAYYSMPLWDSDFWWHVASGRYILQQGTLPDSDPFGVFGAGDSVRNDTVLKGQWLGQVLLYQVFAAFGANGVVALRVLVLVLCVGLVYVRARLWGAAPAALWLVLALVGLNAYGFGGERPQLLSFLFAALFFLCIDLALARRQLRWLLALPGIALIWANSHGGVILGVVLLGLVSLWQVLPRDAEQRWRLAWLGAWLAVALASLFTPNGIKTYYYLLDLQGSVLQARTSEYISALRLYSLGYGWPQLWVYGYFAAALGALWGWRRGHQWLWLCLGLFLAAISISAYRYFAFFLFLAAPYVAAGLSRGFAVFAAARAAPVAGVVAALLLVLALAVGAGRGLLFRGGFYAAAYPVRIADFIARQGLHGRAFNSLEWGGYLLWRLAPRVQLYIDGRMLDQRRFPPYTHILWATPQGRQWFAQAGFSLVILPYHGRFDPQRYPLLDYLGTRSDWQLAYRDDQGVVFVRRGHGLPTE